MKRIFITLALVTASLTTPVQADIRLNDGKVLINSGDPIAKLNRHLKPSRKYSASVCKEPSTQRCRKRDSRPGTIYEYHANKVIYSVQTYGSTITYVEWRHDR